MGLGIEILVETPDEIGPDLRASWVLHLVYFISQLAADHGSLLQVQHDHKLFALDIHSHDDLDDEANESRHVGVLMGLHAPDLPCQAVLPGGPLQVIPAKLLTRAEMDYLLETRRVGLYELLKRFEADGSYHLSQRSRLSVIP